MSKGFGVDCGNAVVTIRAYRNVSATWREFVIPASFFVIPAKAGIHAFS
jgi:hypothetical protein